MSQPDLICNECPLEKCDEKSLWCMYRLLTNPNHAQRQVVTLSKYGHIVVQKASQSEKARKAYLRDYYLKNRDRKLAAAKERAKRPRQKEDAGRRLKMFVTHLIVDSYRKVLRMIVRLLLFGKDEKPTAKGTHY